MYINRNTDYLSRLVAGGKRIYRVEETALLWGITNTQTLRMTLMRYEKRGLLFRLSRGVYSWLPLDKLHPYEVGCAVAGPLSYVSLTTVLFEEGLINQSSSKIWLLGRKKKDFEVGKFEYLCEYLGPRFLVNRKGIVGKEGYEIATAYRALADQLRRVPNYYYDAVKVVNKKQLLEMQTGVGYELATK